MKKLVDSIRVKKRIKEVLENGYLLSLGTTDEGSPWVSDLRYVPGDDSKIYWMSDPNCRHSKAIEKNSQVSATIEINYKFGTPNLGVQISGTARKLSKLEFRLAAKYLTRRDKPEPTKAMKILRNGYYWYELSPDFIELNDEENFGFDNKQKIELK